MNYTSIAKNFKVNTIQGRYITNESIEVFCNQLTDNFHIKIEGFSIENKPIYCVRFGEGKIKILMWSQMHGNESTTTKAVLDFLNFLNTSSDEIIEQWKSFFQIIIIPILNPDGASYYTRVNANKVDLNRDSIELTQPESKLLRRMIDEIQPNFAFNLHDQRSIFGVGATGKSAAISFLSPSSDEERSITKSRRIAMQLIAGINNVLQDIIPGHVGRFDDSFNINCIGDYLQSRNIPVILVEAGQLGLDYNRENTRELVCISLLRAIDLLFNKQLSLYNKAEYLAIIENKKCFYDILWENVKWRDTDEYFIVKIQYQEVLEDKNVKFIPIVVENDNKEHKFAHNTISEKCKFKDLQNFPNVIFGANFENVVALTREEVNYLLKK